jgi:hypothetical protein
MDAKLKLFCVGKFVLWDVILRSTKCLHIVFNNLAPYMRSSGFKPLYVKKLVVHRFDPWKCREFLCIFPKSLAPYVQVDVYQRLG